MARNSTLNDEGRSKVMAKNKFMRVFDKFEDITLVVIFSAMILAISYQVVMRYIFNNSSYWSEELGKFLFVWISWLGVSIGARRNEHIKISILVDRLPLKTAHSVNILAELVVLVISAITAYYAYILVGSQAGIHYAGIKISMAWGYLAVLMGCLLMIMRCLIAIRDSARIISGKPQGTTKIQGFSEAQEGGE